MSYTLLFQKSDTLADTLGTGTGSIDLTSGNFSVSGEQFYVIDYNNSSAEVVKATVSGTTMSITERGIDGTTPVTHNTGANVIMAYVPSHYSALVNGTGFATGTTSVGIPAAAIKQEAWTDYTPTWTATTTNPVIGTGSIDSKYIQIGKTVHYNGRLQMGATTTYGTGYYRISIPVTSIADCRAVGSVHVIDYSTRNYTGVARITAANNLYFAMDNNTNDISPTLPMTWTDNDTLTWSITYEAA